MKLIINHLTFLFLIVACGQSYAQKKMTLHFQDGTEQTGYVTFKKKEAVFQEKVKGKKEKIKYELLDSATTPINPRAKRQRKPKTVYFLSEGKKGKTRGVYDLVQKGTINLYKKTSYAGYSGIWMANGGGPGNPVFMPTPGGGKITIYAIQEKGESNLEVLGTKFSKNMTEYFQDCSELTKKIEGKEKGFRKKDIKNVISYYNTKCSNM